MGRLRLPAALLSWALLALWAVACGTGDAEDREAATTAASDHRAGQTLTSVIGVGNDFEIAYLVAGALPGDDRKIVVWRQSGEDRRWDFIWTLPDETESGILFVESGFAGEFARYGADISFSCEWFGVAPRSSQVEAGCFEGRPSTLRGLVRTLHLPLIATSERQTHAGREADCFEMYGPRGEEGAVCLDDSGLPLMLAGRESGLTGLQVIDAFHINDDGPTEPFMVSGGTFDDLRGGHTMVPLTALLVPLDYLPDRLD